MSKAVRAFALKALLAALLIAGCSINSAKKHYLLAEKLWTDGKYTAAVSEFERASELDPKGKIGLQALFRAATTQSLFLAQYEQALQKFEAYAARTTDPKASWEAEKKVGELLFTRLERYLQVVSHYERLIKKRPDAPEVPEFMFRIGKSHFFSKRSKEALETYQEIQKRFPESPWNEKASYEVGVTYFTRGETDGIGKETYQDAYDTFQAFLKKFPNSPLAPEARFGMASCLEELDQLDAALHAYEAIRSQYPSPKVIDIKLARIRERRAQRSH